MSIKVSRLREIIKEEYDRLIAEDVKADLQAALKSHDWYFEFSDDHRYWKKGVEQQKNIQRLIRQVDKKEAQKLWKKYAPKNKAAGNKPMFPFPDYLYR